MVESIMYPILDTLGGKRMVFLLTKFDFEAAEIS